MKARRVVCFGVLHYQKIGVVINYKGRIMQFGDLIEQLTVYGLDNNAYGQHDFIVNDQLPVTANYSAGILHGELVVGTVRLQFQDGQLVAEVSPPNDLSNFCDWGFRQKEVTDFFAWAAEQVGLASIKAQARESFLRQSVDELDGSSSVVGQYADVADTADSFDRGDVYDDAVPQGAAFGVRRGFGTRDRNYPETHGQRRILGKHKRLTVRGCQP